MSKRKCKRISIKTHMEHFSTEKLCWEHLAKIRWPNGFVCPNCGSRQYPKLSNGLYQCSDCRRQTSVTAGTFMHRSHVCLRKWFLALYFVTQDKQGISATQLAFMIGVNYKTAAMQRVLSREPIMACHERFFRLTWTSSAIVSIVAISVLPCLFVCLLHG